MKIVHIKLASMMSQKGLTQRDLAEKMHMTRSAVNRRMTGAVEWNVSDIKHLCAIFGATFEELFGD